MRLVLGDADGAIADQTRAMELSPEEIDPHLNRGTAEEALQQWDAAAADYNWILERDPQEASALYNLGNVRGSQDAWGDAADLYGQASLARPGFAMARSSEALAHYQLEHWELAERQLRNIIRRYPLFADARAGLSALLWRQGQRGEAESHWAAASGLDPRYGQADWLLEVRRVGSAAKARLSGSTRSACDLTFEGPLFPIRSHPAPPCPIHFFPVVPRAVVPPALFP